MKDNPTNDNPTTFALLFGNRGFFPASLIDSAREELPARLAELGCGSLMMDRDSTRYGGLETAEEGKACARFLREKRGQYQGVILSLPNFGDENGAAIALGEVDVPIFIHAYPDDLDKMAPALRRDAFCGKLSVMDVLRQYGITFTHCAPHVTAPSSDSFASNIDYFARVCDVVDGARNMTVGQIGARTSPFKTVRIDELTLQKHRITTETFDLSDIFARMHAVDTGSGAYTAKAERLRGITGWENAPEAAFDNLTRLAVVLDVIVEEAKLDALSIRCWTEMQEQIGISPCLVTGDLMERRVPAACEVDTGSAVTMFLLDRAARQPSLVLDWNNNYADNPDKCILFHCGNVPSSMMAGKGTISDHAILSNTAGPGKGFGCNTGRIKPMDFTFGNILTEDGTIRMYAGEGVFTPDPIPEDFFGVAGVAEIPRLQDVLHYLGSSGHRHHVAAAKGRVMGPLAEAADRYLGFDVTLPGTDR